MSEQVAAVQFAGGVAQFKLIDPTAIVFSASSAQAERRKHFDGAALKDLIDSVKAKGIVQPIIVRPNGSDSTYELVAGERRVMAAREAGLELIPAMVHELTDEQVQEVQLIENLQREDLHELVEAEGYEVLAKRGMSADEIAHKVGKSKATIYARMKLLALGPKCREAFHANTLSASIALLLARIPGEDLQEKALEKILKPNDWSKEPMSFRNAQRYIQDEFTLKLAGAPFPREDVNLVPAAGPCSTCPKRTGNAPADLFGDIKSADVCTDPVCFKAKRTAFQKRELEKAKSTGAKVLAGAKAKAVLPDRRYSIDTKLRNGYVRPTDKCESDPKKRTYAQLAGKEAEVTLIVDPENGRTSRAFALTDIKAKLKESGVTIKELKKNSDGSTTTYDYEAERKKRQAEQELRRQVATEVVKSAPSKWDRDLLVELVAVCLDRCNTDDVFGICGLTKPKCDLYGSDRIEALIDALTPLKDADLHRLANVAPVIDELSSSYGDWKDIVAAAKSLGADANEIRDRLKKVAEKAAGELAAAPIPPAEAMKKKVKRSKGKKAAKKK